MNGEDTVCIVTVPGTVPVVDRIATCRALTSGSLSKVVTNLGEVKPPFCAVPSIDAGKVIAIRLTYLEKNVL